MAPTPVRNFRLPLALLERIDAARGLESRTSFLIRAAEAFMEPASVLGRRRAMADALCPHGLERAVAVWRSGLGPDAAWDRDVFEDTLRAAFGTDDEVADLVHGPDPRLVARAAADPAQQDRPVADFCP